MKQRGEGQELAGVLREMAEDSDVTKLAMKGGKIIV